MAIVEEIANNQEREVFLAWYDLKGKVMIKHQSVIVFLCIGTILLTTSTGWAQRDPDSSFTFNLSPPGARSLAMGGAFLAFADDATAAYTNPAGLTNLTVGGSEVAIEFRQNQVRNSFLSGGRLFGEPSNHGIDFDPGLVREQVNSETRGLSFLSLAFVFPHGFTLAVYRHELANLHRKFGVQGLFYEDQCPSVPAEYPYPKQDNGLCTFRSLPYEVVSDLDVANYGVSGAFAFEVPIKGRKTTLSIGLGASYYQPDFEETRLSFGLRLFDNPDTSADDRQPGNLFGPAEFGRDNLLLERIESGNSGAFGLNIGVLWKLGEQQRWSIGSVFRQGVRFETSFGVQCRYEGQDREEACNELLKAVHAPERGMFTVPDAFGLGLAYSNAGGMTKVALDYNRVRYSQRFDDFTASLAQNDPEKFRVQDANQLHLGLERIVFVVESLFVGTARAGAWHEPFHELELVDKEDPTAGLFRPAEDELHLSAGFGLVIKEDYQLDFAAEFSDPGDTFSVSLVKFF